MRWLVIILASYLTFFTHHASPNYPFLFAFVILFAASNVVVTLVPRSWFHSVRGQQAITLCDGIFLGGTLIILRIPDTYLYLAFVLVFLLAVIWRDFKLVLLSLLLIGTLFGGFTAFSVAGFALNVSMETFLALSLFFVVAIFYLFFAAQLMRDARLMRGVLYEKRNAQIMVEITRGLSSSLKTQEILRVIVKRLSEVVSASDCSIIVIDARSGVAQVMVRSSEPVATATVIDLETVPELKEARATRQMIFRDLDKHSVAAVPMIVQELVIGLIHVVAENTGMPPSESTIRFFEGMAGAAANALRNAQLFEEVEHRARTDFLTGLPNHRYFQTTLSAEVARAQRHNHALSLLMIDLDHLKRVNDEFGHPSGDLVIHAVAETIRNSCREIDFAARYGGEEFAVILPETPLPGAIHVADRIRERIAALTFPDIGAVTASIGVSNYPTNSLTKEELVSMADQALYIAKNGGRDRVAYFNHQGRLS